MQADHLLDITNLIRAHKHQPDVARLDGEMRLREDLGFDSFDLAELTVRIEERFGVDVCATGVVRTVAEVRARLGER